MVLLQPSLTTYVCVVCISILRTLVALDARGVPHTLLLVNVCRARVVLLFAFFMRCLHSTFPSLCSMRGGIQHTLRFLTCAVFFRGGFIAQSLQQVLARGLLAACIMHRTDLYRLRLDSCIYFWYVRGMCICSTSASAEVCLALPSLLARGLSGFLRNQCFFLWLL